MKRTLLVFISVLMAACNGKENAAGNEISNPGEGASKEERLLSPKATVQAVVGGVRTKIVYCRPSARGRKMLGGNNPFGEVWRTGANEATTVEFESDVLIEGEPLPEGKYALFTIPGEGRWVIIFNKVHDQWGAYNYDPSEDALRVTVDAYTTEDFTETFAILAWEDEIALVWEHVRVPFSVQKSQ